MRVSVSLSDRIPEHAPWESRAACLKADPELFWPTERDRWGSKWAKKVCRECPVTEECLQLALTEGHDEGVWGGLAPVERARLKKRAAS